MDEHRQNQRDLYNQVYDSFIQRFFPSVSKKECQRLANEKWNQIKKDKNLTTVVAQVVSENKILKPVPRILQLFEKMKSSSSPSTVISQKNILELHVGSSEQTSKNDDGSTQPQSIETSSDVESCHSTAQSTETNSDVESCHSTAQSTETNSDVESCHSTAQSSTDSTGTNAKSTVVRVTPAQQKIIDEIELLESDLVGLYKRRDTNLLSTEQSKDLSRKSKELETKKKELHSLKSNQMRQIKFREAAKRRRDELVDTYPELKKKLKVRDSSGRPRLEVDQPLLLSTIIDLATYGSAAHERRQNEVLRSIQSLDDLLKALKDKGFVVSRNGLYLRLQPRRSNSIEGKTHVNTVPVKLTRVKNDFHKGHPDTKFCFTTIQHLEELASLLGPNEVLFLSQDDKARVPIGMAAAHKQSPLLMHMEYRIKLPDHNWVVANRHKLIPSVIAGIIIEPNGKGKTNAVTYSGPTSVSVRSGKHSSSTAASHAKDFEQLLLRPEFDIITKNSKKSVKPV